MDTLTVELERSAKTTFRVGDTIEEENEKKQDAPELAAHGASTVAFATTFPTTEYSTNESTCQIAPASTRTPKGNEKSARNPADESEYSTEALACQIAPVVVESEEGDGINKRAAIVAAHPDSTKYSTRAAVCQIELIPTLSEIEALIGDAAHERIEAAHRELEETRARLRRERIAREKALQSMQSRMNELQEGLANLDSERSKMENKACAFLGGDVLKAVLEKIHLAFNARQLDLEADLKDAEAAIVEAQTEAQAADLTDALELQLGEQELERLEGAAPEVAQKVRLVLSAEENLAEARKALNEGVLRDAAALLEQAKAGGADAAQAVQLERELEEANKKRRARDMIARLTANPDQVGAARRIHKIMEEAQQAGVAELVAPFANKALDTAREAANARFAQARPIADHLVSDGFVPVVGDGRIEAWKEERRNANGTLWKLERTLTLRGREGWTTETPRNPLTQKELPARVRHSRWYHPTRSEPAL